MPTFALHTSTLHRCLFLSEPWESESISKARNGQEKTRQWWLVCQWQNPSLSGEEFVHLWHAKKNPVTKSWGQGGLGEYQSQGPTCLHVFLLLSPHWGKPKLTRFIFQNFHQRKGTEISQSKIPQEEDFRGWAWVQVLTYGPIQGTRWVRPGKNGTSQVATRREEGGIRVSRRRGEAGAGRQPHECPQELEKEIHKTTLEHVWPFLAQDSLLGIQQHADFNLLGGKIKSPIRKW